MSENEMWALVVGFIMPPIVAVFQKSEWSNTQKFVLAMTICMMAAFGNIYFSGEVEGRKASTIILMTLVGAIGTYKVFWVPSGIFPYIEKKIFP